MQFKVPQNIDLEDKIVGPLTLIQFLYLLGGGIIDYLLLVTFGTNWVFWLLGLPVAIVALALAFLKIQDQSLMHFVAAGLVYWRNPKIRFWVRQGQNITVIHEKEVVKKAAPLPPRKHIEKSQLEQLAQVLDTQQMSPDQEANFGQITKGFEKILAQGGGIGHPTQTATSRQHPRPS